MDEIEKAKMIKNDGYPLFNLRKYLWSIKAHVSVISNIIQKHPLFEVLIILVILFNS